MSANSIFLCTRGLRERAPGGFVVERTDLGKVEQAFGVGLCAARLAAKLRQAGADEDDGQFPLGRAMKRRDEGSELLLFDVLQLVDKEHERGSRGFCGLPHHLHERLQVVLEIAVVGEPGLGFEVDSDRDVLILELEGADEASEPAQRPFREGPGLLVP